jgi:hypothetical protein
MPIPTRANHPKAGWAVLLYGPSPEIQLLAGELDDSGLEIVPIGDHFFLQAPEVFGPLSSPEEVAWAAAAVLQQLNTAARLRYAVRLPIHSGAAILVNREGFWDQDDVDRAISEVRGDGTRPLQVSLGKIWTVARHRPHLARALDLLALGSAAWKCAWFRATVYGSTPRRPGLSRRSRFPWPRNQTRAMPPLAAKTFVRSILEQLILLRFKESGS